MSTMRSVGRLPVFLMSERCLRVEVHSSAASKFTKAVYCSGPHELCTLPQILVPLCCFWLEGHRSAYSTFITENQRGAVLVKVLLVFKIHIYSLSKFKPEQRISASIWIMFILDQLIHSSTDVTGTNSMVKHYSFNHLHNFTWFMTNGFPLASSAGQHFSYPVKYVNFYLIFMVP